MEDTMFVIVTKAGDNNWYKVGDVAEVYCEVKHCVGDYSGFYPVVKGNQSWGVGVEHCEKVSSSSLKAHIDFLDKQVVEAQEAYDKMVEIESGCYVLMKYEWAHGGKTVEPVSVYSTYAEAEAGADIASKVSINRNDSYITYKIIKSVNK
jgi:hypothetical protein